MAAAAPLHVIGYVPAGVDDDTGFPVPGSVATHAGWVDSADAPSLPMKPENVNP